MSSIVGELQQELIKSDCDVIAALRKAHIIAAKLNLVDFDSWVRNELYGYDDYDSVPEYRKIRGYLKGRNPFRGWIPIIIDDSKFEDTICVRNITQPISELSHLIKEPHGSLSISFSGGQQIILRKH